MTCFALETKYESGRRFIPVRRTGNVAWLDNSFVGEALHDVLEAVRLFERREATVEWVAENELLGVAEVNLEIIGLHLVASRAS
jgi:hypothetical protein